MTPLGQLLGRHHRALMVSGDRCSACLDYHPNPEEVRAAIAQRERERIVDAMVKHIARTPSARGLPKWQRAILAEPER